MLFFDGAGCHDDLVELVVREEDDFPGVWGCVALYASTVVHLFYLGCGYVDAGLDGVDLVDSTGQGKTEPVAVEEGYHVLARNAFLGLPADVESTAELDMAE